jgi:streptomycin 6-kinase
MMSRIEAEHDGAVELPTNLVAAVSRERPDSGMRAWLDELPRLVPELATRWGLAVGRPFQPGGQTSWVAPATRAGERLVLKIGWRHDEAWHEAEGLRVWDGAGAVRLVDAYAEGPTSALLLEECAPGVPLSDAVSGTKQDEVVAGLLRRLWIMPPAGHPFRPLTQMCDWWADQAEAKGSSLDAAVFRTGLGLFRALPRSAEREALLVTDLHPDNVLGARREPWLVIDPKPYVGDPTYDALQHMLNFPDRLDADPAGFCDRMAWLLDLDPARLRLWLFARCVQESPECPRFAAVAAALAP